MCCDCQHLQPERWGYSCVHCGAWLDIGRAPTKEEVEINCGPCEPCEREQARKDKQLNQKEQP